MAIFLNEEVFSAEMKKDCVRTYFLESGIITRLTEICNKLMQANVKPLNPLDVLREELGDKPVPTESIERLEYELEDAHREIRRLRKILKKLGVPQAEWDDWEEQPNPCARSAIVTEQESPAII